MLNRDGIPYPCLHCRELSEPDSNYCKDHQPRIYEPEVITALTWSLCGVAFLLGALVGAAIMLQLCVS